MKTRAIIQFLNNGVMIIKERLTRAGWLPIGIPTLYYYDVMTNASFLRITRLPDSTHATTKIKAILITRQVYPLIYWKREGRHINHGAL